MADDSRLPAYDVRPGVTFPVWAAGTSPRAREALLATFEAIGIENMWRGYTPAEDTVRTTLLRLYAEAGRAPAIADIARHVGVSEFTIRPVLASLGARDLVVLDADGERIVGAYPWTDRAPEHRVNLGDRTLHALCASMRSVPARCTEATSRSLRAAAPAARRSPSRPAIGAGRWPRSSRDPPSFGRAFARRTAAPPARSARSSPSSAKTRIWRPGVRSTIRRPRAFASRSMRPFRPDARSSARASPGWR